MEEKNLDKIKEDMRENQKAAIKAAVQQTLQNIHDLEKLLSRMQVNVKILKCELFDLKEGRLDRIIERHSLNNGAKEVSALRVEKKASTGGALVSTWYEEYYLKIVSKGVPINECFVNNSMTKAHATGTYKLNDDTVRYL